MKALRRPAAAPAAVVLTGIVALAAAALGGCARRETRLVPEDYEGWKRTTALDLDYPIPGHENHLRRIFINPAGEGVRVETVEGRVRWTYPDGTVLVKEIYPDLERPEGRAPVMLTVMVKAPDDPRARGGWIWVTRDPAAGTESVVDHELCVDCHANANEKHPYGDRNAAEEQRDYVFYPFFPAAPRPAAPRPAAPAPEAQPYP